LLRMVSLDADGVTDRLPLALPPQVHAPDGDTTLLLRAWIVRRSLTMLGAREAAGKTVVERESGLVIPVDLDVRRLDMGRHVRPESFSP
jgi:hypothetical protein